MSKQTEGELLADVSGVYKERDEMVVGQSVCVCLFFFSERENDAMDEMNTNSEMRGNGAV